MIKITISEKNECYIKKKKDKVKILKRKYYFDKADLVQTIIIIAGLAVAAIVAITGITTVVMDKGEQTATCLSNYSSLESTNLSEEKPLYFIRVTGYDSGSPLRVEYKVLDENKDIIAGKGYMSVGRSVVNSALKRGSYVLPVSSVVPGAPKTIYFEPSDYVISDNETFPLLIPLYPIVNPEEEETSKCPI